jgi:hypothetical protein
MYYRTIGVESTVRTFSHGMLSTRKARRISEVKKNEKDANLQERADTDSSGLADWLSNILSLSIC